MMTAKPVGCAQSTAPEPRNEPLRERIGRRIAEVEDELRNARSERAREEIRRRLKLLRFELMMAP